ncbi:MAG: tetratricopeptide repeat protein [Anaeromyxobacteraceae bacterium]
MKTAADHRPAPCPARTARSRAITVAAVVVVALALRFAYLWELRDADALRVLIGDARSYHAWATRIAGGAWLGEGTFYQAPLYPYFLAVNMKLFGPGLLAPRVVQLLLGAAGCGLFAWAASLLLGPRRGLAAGLLLAAWPSAIFHDLLLQKSALDLALVSALLAALAWERRTRALRAWALAGVALGLLGLTRENALALVLPLGGWILVRSRAPGRPGRALGLFAAGLLAVLGPVLVRNAAVGGDLALTTSQLGPNLFIGNNPDASGMYQPVVPGHGDAVYEAADARRIAEEGAGRALTAGEVSHWWTGQVLAFVRDSPGAWLRLLGRKLALLVNAVEVGDVDMPAAYAEWSRLLSALMAVLHLGVLVPAAVAGLVLSWGFWRRAWVVPALLGVYAATVVAFYVMARYRLPLAPLLILLAVAGLPRLAPGRIRRHPGATALACGLALVAGAAANARLFEDPRLDQLVIMESNLGVGLGTAAPDRAIAHFERAIALGPDYAEGHKRMGLLLVELGRAGEALPHLRRALELEQGDPDTLLGLGRAAEQGGRLEEALGWYLRALALDARLSAAELAAGHCLVRLGRPAEAIPHYGRAVAIAPGAAEHHFYLGWALARRGRLEEAERALRQAIALAPGVAEGYSALADVCRAQGRDDEARGLTETAARLAGGR